MSKKPLTITLFGIAILSLYIGSYVYFYANKSPAGNLRYFVYLKGGVGTERRERILYFLFYPAYKIHKCFGGVVHNNDRQEPQFPKDFED